MFDSLLFFSSANASIGTSLRILPFGNGLCGLSKAQCTESPTASRLIPFPKRQILDSSKVKEFANNNFKLDENRIKFSKRVENTVGKGEIARYEQFLLFP